MHDKYEVTSEIAKNCSKIKVKRVPYVLIWMFLVFELVIIGIYLIVKHMDNTKPVPTVHCTKEVYNGHEFLFFSRGMGREDGVVHNPECSCRHIEDKRTPTSVSPSKTNGNRYIIMPTAKETQMHR